MPNEKKMHDQLSHIRHTYRGAILALLADPGADLGLTEDQIRGLRRTCMSITGRPPWSTSVTYAGATTTYTRTLDHEAILAWAQHDKEHQYR